MDHTHSHHHGHGDHCRAHHGGHGHVGHGHDYAEANRHYFDQSYAQKYDARADAIELACKLAQAMLKTHPFHENSTAVMDFACGTGFYLFHLCVNTTQRCRIQGLISREIAPHAKSILGVDISQDMVDQFNIRVQNQGIPSEDMKALCVELRGEEGELDGAKFDVIVVRQSRYHSTPVNADYSVHRHIIISLPSKT
jgi:ubiquinone/menaquinone biosynthesis C-methylase UbiE